MGLHPDLLDGLADMGFTEATPIQQEAIPAALEGKDLLAIAQTGTGKTGAFLIPVLDRLCDDVHDDVDTLIITPTRELAMQIEGQVVGLSYYSGVSAISVYGGRDGRALDSERNAMKQGVDIIVATPGRLKTHMQMGHLDLSKLRCLILDEADRMLDMGFIDDILEVVKKLPKDRQTLLFSATFPPKIQKLARELINMDKVKEIRIAISKPPEAIKQQAYFIHDDSKDALISHILVARKELKRCIVFANRKTKVRELTRTLKRKGLNAASVESGMDQDDREQVLRSFKNGSIPIVVATDVLSRGIDVKDIELVINYDVPAGAEDYVHRIGRTARADTDGEAITLVSPRDKRNFAQIEELIGKRVERPDLPDWLQRGGGSPDRHSSRNRGAKAQQPKREKPSGAPSNRPIRGEKPKNSESKQDQAVAKVSPKAGNASPSPESPAALARPKRRRRPKKGGNKPQAPKVD